MTLAQCQDQCQRLIAQGKTPKTILLCPKDAEGYPDGIQTLYGLRVVVASNYDVSTVVGGVYEKMVLEPNHKKIIER